MHLKIMKTLKETSYSLRSNKNGPTVYFNFDFYETSYKTKQNNTMQYNYYNTIQYHTIQYNTIQYNTIQYNTIQYNTIQYNTIQYNTIQYNTIIQCLYKCGVFIFNPPPGPKAFFWGVGRELTKGKNGKLREKKKCVYGVNFTVHEVL